MRPLLFVTGHAPADRLAPFRVLHERESACFALFGGRTLHGGPAAAALATPHRLVRQSEVLGLAASGRYRAVVGSTGGRLALPAAWVGARRAGVPFLLWSSLWAHPRSPAHVASHLLLGRLYRHADAVVVYGEHVSAYVGARGATNVHIAAQAVDNQFWAQTATTLPSAPQASAFTALFVGRAAPGKGLEVLLRAWSRAALEDSELVLVGVDELPVLSPGDPPAANVRAVGVQPAEWVRNFYGLADVLVVPSLPTSTFREPWGLVVNEAMNQRLPIIASDAVGATAGGLVRHERNGLVTGAADVGALADALRRLRDDAPLRRRLGEAGARDVASHTAAAWAGGFTSALASVGVSRSRDTEPGRTG